MQFSANDLPCGLHSIHERATGKLFLTKTKYNQTDTKMRLQAEATRIVQPGHALKEWVVLSQSVVFKYR